MPKILKVNRPADYSSYIGQTDRHPLVSVIDYAAAGEIRHSLVNWNIYGLFFHEKNDIGLTYGRGHYDYEKGAVICVAPGQIGGREDNGERIRLTGWGLLFHPDLLNGHALARTIKNYHFFDYSVNEALQTTPAEYAIFEMLMRRLQAELQGPNDLQQDDIVVGYIELILNYCQRFYNRQFAAQSIENKDLLGRFAEQLHQYFDSGHQFRDGLPTVQYCAGQLCMSPNYFGDVIKKATGDTAGNYIRNFIVQRAKNLLSAGNSVARTAYDLGFDYPQHLSRMFKNREGISPSEYCRRL